MTRVQFDGYFDLPDPGQTTRFEGPLGRIEIFREHDLPLVDVLPGGPIGDAYAMCVHPTFLKNRVWQHTDAWFDRLLGLGVKTIRGMLNPSNAGSQRVLDLCLAHDVKWIATIIPEDGYDWTKDQVQTRAKFIRAAILTGARIDVELMNEPDHPRGTATVPDNWPAIMVRHAQWIREILPDIHIVSCSLHAGADSFERDWNRLGAAGLGPLVDSIGIHDYDNGYEPCQATDWRIDVARKALGEPNKPVDVTEYGHTTSVNNPQQERNPTSLQAAAAYAWRGHLDRVVTRDIRHAARFELLDDPDPQAKITEAGFGVVDCPSLDPTTWTDKPEAGWLRIWMALLDDTDPTFQPDPIRLRMEGDGVWSFAITQVSGRPPVLWLWRSDTRVWDPEQRVDLDVPPLPITVTTERDVHTVDIAGGMTTIELTELA